MRTYQSVMAKIAELQKDAERLKRAERDGVIDRIQEAMEAYDITPEELGAPRKKKHKTTAPTKAPTMAGVPKYYGTRGETWTGRGKRPNWFKELLYTGLSPDTLEKPDWYVRKGNGK